MWNAPILNKNSYKCLSMLMLPFHNKFIFSFIILNMLLRLCVYYNNNSNERIQNPVIRDDNLIRKYPFMCNLWMKNVVIIIMEQLFLCKLFLFIPILLVRKGYCVKLRWTNLMWNVSQNVEHKQKWMRKIDDNEHSLQWYRKLINPDTRHTKMMNKHFWFYKFSLFSRTIDYC